MRLINGLGFTFTASSDSFLLDITPPSPGNLISVISDAMESLSCDELNVTDLNCLENSTGLLNHRQDTLLYLPSLIACYIHLMYSHTCNYSSLYRVIVDDARSSVVFNGPTPFTDVMYTSTRNLITGIYIHIMLY